jgi:hypothetical protein
MSECTTYAFEQVTLACQPVSRTTLIKVFKTFPISNQGGLFVSSLNG